MSGVTRAESRAAPQHFLYSEMSSLPYIPYDADSRGRADPADACARRSPSHASQKRPEDSYCLRVPAYVDQYCGFALYAM